MKIKSLPIGYKSGDVTIIKVTPQGRGYHYDVQCKCNNIIQGVHTFRLKYKSIKSCGCRAIEKKMNIAESKRNTPVSEINKLIQSKSWKIM